MLKKAYFEITNACNLACSFCHGTRRPIRFVSVNEFAHVASELAGRVDYLYFHVLGEPLLHPDLTELLSIAHSRGLRVILTTNGTLLSEKRDILLASPAIHKIGISLHSYEVNRLQMTLDDYLDRCFSFSRDAADSGVIAVMRLWNEGGADSLNDTILEWMHRFFPGDWKEIYSGFKLCDRVFLEWGEKFDWPDEDADFIGSNHSCYGLRDQIGILSDGTVIPCCLDAEGSINLGNIFDTPLADILASSRAVKLKRSFEVREVSEELCRRCGYAAMKKYR